MTQRFLKILLLAVFSVMPLSIFGQASTAGQLTMPFAAGESLKYEAKLSKIIKGIPVAELNINVNSGADGNFLIGAQAVSKGTALKIFRYSFEQIFTSTVDPDEFRILKTVKHDVQKERVRESEALFDYEQKLVTWVETDPKEPMRSPRRIASNIPEDTHDVISGIFQIRLLPLKVGETFDLTVSDSGLAYNIPVYVAAREKQNTVLGKVWCYRIEPKVFGPGRIVEQDGSMIIWMTDDDRRIPVRGQVNMSLGRIEIKLRSAQNLKKANN